MMQHCSERHEAFPQFGRSSANSQNDAALAGFITESNFDFYLLEVLYGGTVLHGLRTVH